MSRSRGYQRSYKTSGPVYPTAGWLLSFTQLIGLPAGFIVPVLAGHIRSQRSIAAILGLASVLGYSGLLLFGTNYPVMITSIVFIGIGLGGTFPLGLAFLGLRSKNARQAAELSGMAQSIGYILAAVGPILIGSLFDFTHTWTVPLHNVNHRQYGCNYHLESVLDGINLYKTLSFNLSSCDSGLFILNVRNKSVKIFILMPIYKITKSFA